ncbi:MAG: ATP-NAD kinase, partial [Acidimicrobiia bacterium]
VGVRSAWTGARALWVPDELVEAVIGLASPTSVGLASVAAGLGPLPSKAARYLRFGGGTRVRAVLAPGLVVDVGVAEHRLVDVGASVTFSTASRTLALDGERHLVTSEPPTVTVTPGPRILDPLIALDGREARS